MQNAPSAARVALYMHKYVDACPEGVFGRDVAVESFLTALVRHGRAGAYQYFYTPEPMASAPPDHGRLATLAEERDDISLAINRMAELKEDFERFPFRVWHDVDGDWDNATSLRTRYARRLYPISATFHALSYQGLLYGWFLKMLLSRAYACDSLVCTSRAARHAARKVIEIVAERFRRDYGVNLSFPGRLDVIPLGVDVETFRPRPKAEVRRELNLPEDAFLLLWLGRLSFCDKADLLPLLRVFQQLVADNPSRNLLLVIGGSGTPAYATLIGEYATALGIGARVRHIEPLEVSRRHLYHAAADVFVSPIDSIQETFGLTPIEAMASGVPQVVSDWDGYRDTVKHGETGFLIPTYWANVDAEVCLSAGIYDEYNLQDHVWMSQATAVDPFVLRRALQELIAGDELRGRMAEASRTRAERLFSWPAVIVAYETLWEEQHQEAGRHTFVPPPAPDFTVPAFADIFGHYATFMVGGEAGLVLTEAGAEAAHRAPFVSSLRALGVMSEEVMGAALEFLLAKGGRAGFADLEHRLSRTKGRGAEEIRGHLMWLIKYGYARLEAAPTGDKLAPRAGKNG